MNVNDIIKKLKPSRRKKIEQRAQELIKEYKHLIFSKLGVNKVGENQSKDDA